MSQAQPILALALCAALASPPPVLAQEPPQARVEGLGKIDFPNSGADEAQEPFIRGVLLLHSFEYRDAAEAFREAQEADRDFALAYWGEALTHSHPVWNEDYPEKGRGALTKLAQTPNERLVKAPTQREKDILRAAEILYGEGERMERNRAYSEHMGRLYESYPDDLEIAAFYALSILATSGEGRQIPIYMRAAAIAEEVYAKNPEHPGALHYAIHAYDDPVHAPLGLRMARSYGQVASRAEHALHMPSHIYVALGMWAESVAANESSSAAADERRERKGLDVDARGYHSLWWLAYTYQQLGRFDEADRLLDDMVRDNAEGGSRRTRSHLIRMRTAYVIDSLAWEDERIEIEVSTEDLGVATASADFFVQGLAAAELGRLEEARAALQALRDRRTLVVAQVLPASGLASCCSPAIASKFIELSPDMQAANILELLLEARILAKADKTEEALVLFEQACENEDAMGFDFGPPSVVKPAHELFGEYLLELGRTEDAAREFAQALERAPRRARSVLGRARALQAAEDEDATEAWRTFARLWANADRSRPERKEAAPHTW